MGGQRGWRCSNDMTIDLMRRRRDTRVPTVARQLDQSGNPHERKPETQAVVVADGMEAGETARETLREERHCRLSNHHGSNNGPAMSSSR